LRTVSESIAKRWTMGNWIGRTSHNFIEKTVKRNAKNRPMKNDRIDEQRDGKLRDRRFAGRKRKKKG
jgi:hypothetical protein